MGRSNHEGDCGSSTLTTFLFGGAVGAILGLLYAPGSGEETRRRIKFYTEEASDKAVEKMQRAREETLGAIEKVKGSVLETKEKFTTAVDAGKSAYQEEREELEESL